MTVLDRSRAPRPGDPRDLPFPPFDHREALPGLDTFLAPLEETALVTLGLLTPGGAQHDPPELPGLAGFTAGVLDQGTEESSAFEIASRTERLGASLSVSASWDALSIEIEGLPKDLPALLDLLAEIALRPVFPEAEVERVRGRRLTEILRRRTLPQSLASERFAAEVYGDRPYGHPRIGNEASVSRITREDLMEHYGRFVRSPGSTFVAAGRFDPEELFESIRELFHDWPGGDVPGDPAILPVPRDSLSRAVVDRAGAPQTELRLGHAGPPRNHPDRTALVVLSSILGGKFTSRLNLELREKLGLTYGIRSRFAGRRGPGPFLVSAAVATPGVGTSAETILRELRALRDEPVSEEELEETKRYLIGVFPYTLQAADDVARCLARIATYELPDEHYDTYRERIEAVTRDDVLRVARRHLHPDRAVIVAVGPEDRLEDQLREISAPASP